MALLHSIPRRAASLLFVALLPALPLPLPAVFDDFDDGNDEGWTRLDPLNSAGVAAPVEFSFPSGAYRMVAPVPAVDAAGPARGFTYLPGQEYTGFYCAVDILDWDDSINQAFGILGRARNIGLGQTTGYVFNYDPNQTGSRPGGQFQMNRVTGEAEDGTIAAADIKLISGRSYRFVCTGEGNTLSAHVFDLEDLTSPLVSITTNGDDDERVVSYPEGVFGLFNFYRGDATDPIGIPDVTFDNFEAHAENPFPGLLPGVAHGKPGLAQVIHRSPASNANFHSASQGIRFTVSTLSETEDVDPASITLILNSNDVTDELEVTPNADGYEVVFNGLRPNETYQAVILSANLEGQGTANRFSFDTFEASLVEAGEYIAIEAEDYNHGGGLFQDNPPPSGITEDGSQVNGDGAGYFELSGTPEIDYFDFDSSPQSGNDYRPDDFVGLRPGSEQVQPGPLVNDSPRARYTGSGARDYQIARSEAGEWLNYTRTFPAGAYRVYLRAASIAAQDALLSQVTTDPSQPNQQTAPLGRFAVPNQVTPQTFLLFPLLNSMDQPVEIELSGVTTLRLTLGGPPQDFAYRRTLVLNYLLLAPVSSDDPNLVVTRGGVFGSLPEDSGPVERSISIFNSGTAQDLQITNAALSGPEAAHYEILSSPSSLPPGDSESLVVRFDPGSASGAFTATLLLTSNDSSDPEIAVDLSARIPLPEGLIAHYPLDDAGPEMAADASGNRYDAVYGVNGGTHEFRMAPLASGTAVGFSEGTGAAYLLLPREAAAFSADFSVALWLNQDPGDANGTLLSLGDQADPFALALAGGQLIWGVEGQQEFASEPVLQSGVPAHLVLTYARQANTALLRFYLDGTLAAEKADASLIRAASGAAFQIGAMNGALGFTGRLDDVQIYNRALDPAEAAFLFSNPGSTLAGDEPPDPSLDSDGDGMTDAAEAIAGTDPFDSSSFLTILTIESASDGVDIVWSSVPGHRYQVEHLIELGSVWNVVTEVASAGATTSFADRDPGRTTAPQGHYRVRAFLPAPD
ncbi:MAG TPA: LamG-like jellyroll fold domain-containing protein [Verrucomicrobiales bacterium]|nr:LamG-like jellyroll fold domain-containing protein [Verrucomicrobiales bacterium]